MKFDQSKWKMKMMNLIKKHAVLRMPVLLCAAVYLFLFHMIKMIPKQMRAVVSVAVCVCLVVVLVVPYNVMGAGDNQLLVKKIEDENRNKIEINYSLKATLTLPETVPHVMYEEMPQAILTIENTGEALNNVVISLAKGQDSPFAIEQYLPEEEQKIWDVTPALTPDEAIQIPKAVTLEKIEKSETVQLVISLPLAMQIGSYADTLLIQAAELDDVTMPLSMADATDVTKEAELSVDVHRERTPLTVTAPNKTITVGEAVPHISVNEYQIEGLIENDDISVIEGLIASSYQTIDTSQPGTVCSDILNLYAEDYVITFIPGVLTIEASQTEGEVPSQDDGEQPSDGGGTVSGTDSAGGNLQDKKDPASSGSDEKDDSKESVEKEDQDDTLPSITKVVRNGVREIGGVYVGGSGATIDVESVDGANIEGTERTSTITSICYVVGEMIYEVPAIDGKATIPLAEEYIGSISYYCRDAAGNRSPVITDQYAIEADAPQISTRDQSLTDKGNGDYVTSEKVRFVLADEVTGIHSLEVLWDGEQMTEDGEEEAASEVEEPQTAELKTENSDTESEKIESDLENTESNSSKTAEKKSTKNEKKDVYATENVTNIEIGSETVASQMAVDVFLETEGEHTLELRATDYAGNVSTKEYSFKVTKAQTSNEIISMVLPTNFKIQMNPESGEVESDPVVIQNLNDYDVKVAIKGLNVDILKSADEGETKKNLDLFMNISGNSKELYNSKTEIGVETNVSSFVVKAASRKKDRVRNSETEENKLIIRFSGLLDEETADLWDDGELKVKLVFDFNKN